MGTPLYMSMNEAIVIVQTYGDEQGVDAFDEALALIESSYDDLEQEVRVAYRMVSEQRNTAFNIKY